MSEWQHSLDQIVSLGLEPKEVTLLCPISWFDDSIEDNWSIINTAKGVNQVLLVLNQVLFQLYMQIDQ